VAVRIDLGAGADLEPLVAALVAGQTVVIPTDTVYGLACAADLPVACERTVRLKGRDLTQPSAVLVGSSQALLERVLPSLAGGPRAAVERLLPGPVTLVLPNPEHRYRWLCGDDQDRLGVRVPPLDPRLAAALDLVGAVLATSANLHGEPAPAALSEVSPVLLEAVAVTVDGGPTPRGVASTVIDVSGAEPRVLREGALPADEALARLAGPSL
jgi:tRNA threonylcarbamoyl adenosine modification protein (Sua5/YciO/YrdC/YwlC family)